jgi:hypothetical protein
MKRWSGLVKVEVAGSESRFAHTTLDAEWQVTLNEPNHIVRRTSPFDMRHNQGAPFILVRREVLLVFFNWKLHKIYMTSVDISQLDTRCCPES